MHEKRRSSFYLSQFKSVVPKHLLSQQRANEWISKLHFESLRTENSGNQGQAQDSTPHRSGGTGESPQMSEERLQKFLARYLIAPGLIDFRGSVLSEVMQDPSDLPEDSIYRVQGRGLRPAQPHGAGIDRRNQAFDRAAREALQELFPESDSQAQSADHLVHVTCTGYVSPSPVQWLCSRPAFAQTQVTHAYHMGCYAALPAIRLAGALAQAEGLQKVDLVHTEYCSLHLDPSRHEPEQLVVQSLFADGSIKYRASQQRPDEKCLEVVKILEQRIPDTLDEMTWIPTPHGMQMTLSRKIPERIEASLRSFFEQLIAPVLSENETRDLQEWKARTLFAIHPGGPRIIDAVQKVLELTDEQTSASRAVLRERGNMSSATLPHVWEKMISERKSNQSSEEEKPQWVVSFAFGPGLTVFGSLMKLHGSVRQGADR